MQVAKFGLHQIHRLRVIPRVVREIVEFAKSCGVERLWAVLNAPHVIDITLQVARKLDVPLYTQVWDPPEHFLPSLNMDAWSFRLMFQAFNAVQRRAAHGAVVSETMAEAFYARYGLASIIVRHAVSAHMMRPLTDRPHNDDKIIVGFAGSLYANHEWAALLNTLNQMEWKVKGREVQVRVLGNQLNIESDFPVHLEYYGWQPTDRTISLLAEADVLYLPYWFDPAFTITTQLAFPSKLSTYVAAGRPVMFHGPESAAPSSYISESGIGLCCHSLRSEDIVDTLESFVESQISYAEMIESIQAVREEFTRNLQQQRFAEFLQLKPAELLSGG